MARNEEGDFELVMGNRQLLSGFFIVVILFGVFFTMGYIVGRHSTPAPMSAGVNPEPIPRGVSAPPPGEAVLAPVESSKPEEAPAAPENPAPVTSTRPATAPPEAPSPATTPKPVETKRAPATHSVAGARIAEPAPGSYLQVLAPKLTAAGGVVDSLKSKGITAVLAPGPTEDSVRILVGPLDSSSMGKMRVDLESAGFKPFAKRY